MIFTLSPLNSLLLTAGLLAGGLAQAQTAPASLNRPANRPSSLGWQACQALKNDANAQLMCFQQWADSQLPANAPPAAMTTAPANPATGQPATQILLLPSLNTEAPDGKPIGCRNTQYSELSRFWELQRGSAATPFPSEGYLPTSLAVVVSGGSNEQPSSPSADHTALTETNAMAPALAAPGLFCINAAVYRKL